MFGLYPTLKRYPVRPSDTLQAWDAADELILSHLNENPPEGRLLIVGDSFGALSTALAGLSPTVYTDSYSSAQGIALNAKSLGGNPLTAIHDLSELQGVYDTVLIRLPKNMSFFEDILCRLSSHLRPGSKIICGYMIKYQSKTSFELLNKIIGATTTSLAKKKARLIFSKFERNPTKSPYPLEVAMDGFEKPFVNHSGVFSREKLDIGTRFFLDNIPTGDFNSILDLGCGNGIIGIAAGLSNTTAKIVMSDDSMMAVKSARANYKSYIGSEPDVRWLNCFENSETGVFDLVLCNPPFHQGNTMGDFVAWQMFKDAFHALTPGGTLRIIGNSHLMYQVRLREIFGNSEIIAQNQKFIIAEAVKSAR